MNVKECADRVDAIIAMDVADDDPEAAHIQEDDLMREVIQAVAAGEPNVRDLAQEVLRLLDPDRDVTRWYA